MTAGTMERAATKLDTSGHFRVSRNGKIYWCEHCNQPFPSHRERDHTVTKHFEDECTAPPEPDKSTAPCPL